jgi:cation diffusion facilitator CzcD-associated flavoprotein CzcO
MLPVPGSWWSGPGGIGQAQREGVPMPYRVVVIGAGFGGIGMAVALKQAGIEDFVVVDRADDLGGTWRDKQLSGPDLRRAVAPVLVLVPALALEPTLPFDRQALTPVCGTLRLAAHLNNHLGVHDDEQGAPVWTCSALRGSWTAIWPGLRFLG